MSSSRCSWNSRRSAISRGWSWISVRAPGAGGRDPSLRCGGAHRGTGRSACRRTSATARVGRDLGAEVISRRRWSPTSATPSCVVHEERVGDAVPGARDQPVVAAARADDVSVRENVGDREVCTVFSDDVLPEGLTRTAITPASTPCEARRRRPNSLRARPDRDNSTPTRRVPAVAARGRRDRTGEPGDRGDGACTVRARSPRRSSHPGAPRRAPRARDACCRRV